MCPSVSGIGSKDAALSAELGMCALHLALGQSEVDDSIPETGGILLPGGSLVIKLLEGEESQGTYLSLVFVYLFVSFMQCVYITVVRFISVQNFI